MKKLGFLIDMDGVLYKNNELISGAKDFIEYLQKNNIPFLFLTNNSRPTPKDLALKLKNMGLKVSEDSFYTSAMATASFLAKQKPDDTCYVIGEGGLLNAINQKGLAITDTGHVDFVVVGEGRNLSAESLEKAINMLLQGAKLISTNMDRSPRDLAWMKPGCKAITKLLCEAASVESFSVGKPSSIIYRNARKKLGLSTDEIIMVGDSMEMDIFGGISSEFYTILVLTGDTKKEDLAKYPYSPDKVLDSIKDVIPYLESL